MSKPYQKYIWGVLFAVVLIAVDATFKPYLVKIIIDTMDTASFGTIATIMGIFALLQGVVVWSWAFYDTCYSKLCPALVGHITTQFLTNISLYTYSFFQQNSIGNITSKWADAAQRSPKLIITLLNDFLRVFLIVFISFILIARVHYGFGIAMLLWLCIFCVIGYVKIKQCMGLSNLEASSDAVVRGNMVEYLNNIFAIKIFASQKHEQKKLSQSLEVFVHKSKASLLFVRSYFMIQGSIFSLYMLLCVCFMIYLRRAHRITSGDFALLFMLNLDVAWWMLGLLQPLKNFIIDFGFVEQALTLLDTIPEIQDKPGASILRVTQGAISFQNVTFGYGANEPLFQNLSVVLKPGQKVGLVGQSGGGKTTFINLILRLYEVQEGGIFLDGQDIRDVTQDSLRRHISLIPQDPALFNRSILENIRYGRLEASDAEVEEAAKQACAHQFIRALPQGYATLAGERGTKLSGGQRQRIAIARAILKNAPILMLDEATSQLDSLTEQEIQESLWPIMEGKTTLVIAHRLSTLVHMDRILVFDKGGIVEDGIHEELLSRGSVYKTLWEA